MNQNFKRVGVVVGRFQVAALHEGHMSLLRYAQRESDSVVVVLGNSSALLTSRNPLPSSVRARVIKESFPNATILEHSDHPSDEEWSKGLDALLTNSFPGAEIKLYASRDSFFPYYSGTLPVVVAPAIAGVSGTKQRAECTNEKEWNESFRKGLVYAQTMRQPISYQAVDIAVLRHPTHEILLGQKASDCGKWRLIGGFVDVSDSSLESAALRELREEAGNVLTHELSYLGSYSVDDWRYRSERDKILTALFLTYELGGSACAGDDLAKVAWHSLSIEIDSIVESHRPLFAHVQNHVLLTTKEQS